MEGATSISLLVVLGVRRDGQKVLLSVRDLGGESEAARRTILDDLVARGLPTCSIGVCAGPPINVANKATNQIDRSIGGSRQQRSGIAGDRTTINSGDD